MQMYDVPIEEQQLLLEQLKQYGKTITYEQLIDSRVLCKQGLVYDYVYGQLRFFTITGSGFSAVDSSGHRVTFRATRFKKFRTDAFRFESTTGWEEYCLYKEAQI
jgi:hypothetical protein